MTRGGKPKRLVGWLDEIVGWSRRPDRVIRDEDVNPEAAAAWLASFALPEADPGDLLVVHARTAEAAGEAFSAALAAAGRQIGPDGATALRGALMGGSWDNPAEADPIADERRMIEAMRRAYDVPTEWIPIENSRGQRTGDWVEVPTSELRAWRSQADRYGKFRPGLVAEIERRCWEATR